MLWLGLTKFSSFYGSSVHMIVRAWYMLSANNHDRDGNPMFSSFLPQSDRPRLCIRNHIGRYTSPGWFESDPYQKTVQRVHIARALSTSLLCSSPGSRPWLCRAVAALLRTSFNQKWMSACPTIIHRRKDWRADQGSMEGVSKVARLLTHCHGALPNIEFPIRSFSCIS